MSRKLTYFNFNGYAEFTRYMLHYGNVDFEDIRYNLKDWPIQSVKDSLPYGQMPLYEENGRTINQSFAIARYVASTVGLLPSDPWDQAVLDATVLNIYDLLIKLLSIKKEENPENKEEVQKKVDEVLEFFLSRFEKELKATNGHFSGKLSWADFVLIAVIEGLNIYVQKLLQKDYPAIEALMTEIHGLPGVKEYVARRPEYSL